MIPSTIDLLREELAHKRTLNCDTITLAVPLVEQLLARGDVVQAAAEFAAATGAPLRSSPGAEEVRVELSFPDGRVFSERDP